MTTRYVILVPLICVAIFAFMAGCTTTPGGTPTPTATPTSTATTVPAEGSPQITITSPQNGATLPAGNVTVNVQVSNFNIVDKQGQASVPGEGHVHFYMDVSPIPTDPTKPAIPANASAA